MGNLKTGIGCCLVGLLFVASCAGGEEDLSVDEVQQAVCSGSGCNGKDAPAEGCNVNVSNGQSNRVSWGPFGVHYLNVVVRKTASCGGVKWPQASTDQVCGVFSTWLADSSGNELSGTRYSTSSPGSTQIYGDMWSGPVKACASVCGQSICTALDP